MEINWGAQRHPSSWLFVVKEMDGGSLCQPHAAAITPAAMMDGGEGKGGWREGDREGHLSRPLIYLSLQGLGWRGGVCGEWRGSASPWLLVKGLFFSFSLPWISFFAFRRIRPARTWLIKCPDHSNWFPQAYWILLNILGVRVCIMRGVSVWVCFWQAPSHMKAMWKYNPTAFK